jgi:hypothetical protein
LGGVNHPATDDLDPAPAKVSNILPNPIIVDCRVLTWQYFGRNLEPLLSVLS